MASTIPRPLNVPNASQYAMGKAITSKISEVIEASLKVRKSGCQSKLSIAFKVFSLQAFLLNFTAIIYNRIF